MPLNCSEYVGISALVVHFFFTYTLLQRANELVRNKIHPTIIMSGYRMAMKEAIKYLKVRSADCQLLTGNAGFVAAVQGTPRSFIILCRQTF